MRAPASWGRTRYSRMRNSPTAYSPHLTCLRTRRRRRVTSAAPPSGAMLPRHRAATGHPRDRGPSVAAVGRTPPAMLECDVGDPLPTGDPTRPPVGMVRRAARPSPGHLDHGGRGGAHAAGGQDRLQAARHAPAHGGGGLHRPAVQPARRPVATGRGAPPRLRRHHRHGVRACSSSAGLAYPSAPPWPTGSTHLISKLPTT